MSCPGRLVPWRSVEDDAVAVAPEGLKPLIEFLPGGEGDGAALTGHFLVGGAVSHAGNSGVLGSGGGGGHRRRFV
jgi:hypothetical protein